jgi:serine/threonine protein kinase
VKTIHDYALDRRLGAGNLGTCYLASTPARLASMGLDVAHICVKVLDEPASREDYLRVVDRLKAVAVLRSEYLVNLYEVGFHDDDTILTSMEYVPLGSLEHPKRRLSKLEVLLSVARAARGAHVLHEASIVHRNVKPANVLFSDQGSKLSDVDLAHVMRPNMTMSGLMAIDAIEYMDPRVVKGEKPTRASDVWSFGVTLHKALTGASIYGSLPDDSVVSAMRAVVTRQPVIDDTLLPQYAEIVKACLEPDPVNRVPTGLALAEMIEKAV